MNKNWKDRAVTELYIKMQKRSYLKWFYKLCGFLVSIIYSVQLYFISNVKRHFGIIASILMFIVTSSFCFKPEEVVTLNSTEIKDEWIAISESFEYQPLDLDEYTGKNYTEELDEEIDSSLQYSLDDLIYAASLTKNYNYDDNKELDSTDWRIILVNKQHPVPDGYSCELATISGGLKCDARIINDLVDMMSAALSDGVELRICSPYRSFDRQTVLFNNKLDYYMKKGYSYLEAYKISAITVNVPGHSEHQLGLALDIVSDTYSALDAGFGDTAAGIWLKENGYKYGFILRYPLGKEYVTGIEYEPWHYRYVGKKAATLIMQQQITLEEFVATLD